MTRVRLILGPANGVTFGPHCEGMAPLVYWVDPWTHSAYPQWDRGERMPKGIKASHFRYDLVEGWPGSKGDPSFVDYVYTREITAGEEDTAVNGETPQAT